MVARQAQYLPIREPPRLHFYIASQRLHSRITLLPIISLDIPCHVKCITQVNCLLVFPVDHVGSGHFRVNQQWERETLDEVMLQMELQGEMEASR